MSAAPQPRRAVPILLYHAVTDRPGSHIAPFAVSAKTFAEQMDDLVESGLRCLTVQQYVAGPAWGEEPVAVVTFDDGYADFADEALPVLLERQIPVTLYVTTGWMQGRGPTAPGPSDRMLSWAQLRDLASAGVEIGAHSHSHPHMDTLGRAGLDEELVRPKELLEDALGVPVESFAYPHGYSGPRVRERTRTAGYVSAAGVRDALSHSADHPYQLGRLMLRADTPREQFREWMQQRGAPLAGPVEDWRIRGWRAYRRGRSLLRRSPISEYA